MIVESERFCAPKERTRGDALGFMQSNAHAWLSVSNIRVVIKYFADMFDRLLRHQTASSRQSSNPKRRVRCFNPFVQATYIDTGTNTVHDPYHHSNISITQLKIKIKKEEKRVPAPSLPRGLCASPKQKISNSCRTMEVVLHHLPSPSLTESQEYKSRTRRLTTAVSSLSRGAKKSQLHTSTPKNP
jgi:hypothetical protein